MKHNLAILLTLLSLTTMGRADGSYSPKPADQPLSYITRLNLKADDLRQLSAGEVVARTLSTKNSKSMSGMGIMLTNAGLNAVVDAYRNLAMFQQSPDTLEYGRFSSPPQVKDLDGLTVEDKDLFAFLTCEVNGSDVKLSQQEIARMRAASGNATRLSPSVKARLTVEYKKLLVERVRNYLTGGAAAWSGFADKEETVHAPDAFATLAREQAETARHCDHLYAGLLDFPRREAGEFETFIYWAKQKYGKLKPVISITQVFLHRDGDRFFIASKQLYTSHYMEAGLGIAELIPTLDAEGQPRTVIAYTLRMQVDMLGGSMSFFSRRMAQSKMLTKLKESLRGFRQTLEARPFAGS